MVFEHDGQDVLDDLPLAFLVFIVVLVVIGSLEKLVVNKSLKGSEQLHLLGGFGDVIAEERFDADLVESGVLVVLVLAMTLRRLQSTIGGSEEGYTSGRPSGGEPKAHIVYHLFTHLFDESLRRAVISSV